MRGSDKTSGSLFSYVDLEDRMPAGHPLQVIREIVNDALADLDPELERLYEGSGRASIAPERLLHDDLSQCQQPRVKSAAGEQTSSGQQNSTAC